MVPFGSLANASSVGANIVYGPFPFRVSIRPAALAAVSRVLKVPAFVATSTIVDMLKPCAGGEALLLRRY